MKKALSLLAVLVLLFSSCGVNKTVVVETPKDKEIKPVLPVELNEEYKIYGDYFDAKLAAKPPEEILVNDMSGELVNPKLIQSLKLRIKMTNVIFYNNTSLALDPETADSFFVNNNASLSWAPFITGRTKCVLVGEELIETLRKSENNEYWTKHPGSAGVYRLSKAGFNAKKDQALIYVSRWGGKLNGDGEFVLMVKDGGKWVPAYVYSNWTN